MKTDSWDVFTFLAVKLAGFSLRSLSVSLGLEHSRKELLQVAWQRRSEDHLQLGLQE